MKKLFTLFLLFASIISVFSQDKIVDFPSNELGKSRLIKIHVPKSYESNTKRVYPLTIILDSEYLFDIYVSNAKLFANKDKAPEQIIVGITQNQGSPKERYIDCEYDEKSSMPTRESLKFYKFIRDELLLYMNGNYRISPYKTIVGNTLTANFINYFLVDETPAFTAYVNLNPSYAPDMAEILHDKIPEIEEDVFYYSISGMYNEQRHENILEIDNLLRSSQNELFKYRFDNVKNSTKIASMGSGISNAMAFLFKKYAAISKKEFKYDISFLSPPEVIEYLEKKYIDIEYLFGTNMKIRERDIYAVEGIIIDKEKGDYLKEFGEMINRLYPESPIGDYYIGKYYETGRDYKRALKYYKNGFTKIDATDPNREGYFINVERVLKLRKHGAPPIEEEIADENIKEKESEEKEGEEKPEDEVDSKEKLEKEEEIESQEKEDLNGENLEDNNSKRKAKEGEGVIIFDDSGEEKPNEDNK